MTPLFDVHRDLGATFTDFAGRRMPLRYQGELAEHHAVRRAAGLFDLSHMGELEVTGADAGRFLDHALVGRLSTLPVGRARYTMLCHDTGGVLDDLVVYRLAERRYLVVANAANTTVVHVMLREHADGFGVDVRDASADWALIAVQGPAAAAMLDPGPLPYYGIRAFAVAGRDVLLARTGYTGEDGFEVYCRPADAVAVWRSLLDRGPTPAGLACRDTLRLEAGMALYGHELSVRVTPLQAGLERVVAFDKRDFVGAAALRRQRATGGFATLVGLVTGTRRAPRAGYPVLAEGTTVGAVTSGALSPTLGHPVAMAYVAAGWSAPGTRLTVDVRGTGVDAHVVTLPFYSSQR
ncbi:glycine cleavage system aminomethyltransferase GcvT [Dactylosporangium siamense]|uniref:aminomethyltransferase n=1 Tax=Dactylosporangium siamense TaxID=685454 RepID=A0A919U507_9ACTN|nr:glycine cleavage system aminomethyltransferase GcvT [Dactylosporangium siamense]GIG42729.1 aminomethyltransferase [Dactylosporangium siamense]